jgi:hypothetical protein
MKDFLPSRDGLLYCSMILLAVTRIKHSPSEVILEALFKLSKTGELYS